LLVEFCEFVTDNTRKEQYKIRSHYRLLCSPLHITLLKTIVKLRTLFSERILEFQVETIRLLSLQRSLRTSSCIGNRSGGFRAEAKRLSANEGKCCRHTKEQKLFVTSDVMKLATKMFRLFVKPLALGHRHDSHENVSEGASC